MAGTSGDSGGRVSGILFWRIHDSLGTQGLPQNWAETSQFGSCQPSEGRHGSRPETDLGLQR
jgi:hypothetical protein